jgi:hypothetical protein
MNDLLTSLPAWAVSAESQAWFYGLGAGALIRVTRASLRWFKRVDTDSGE